MRGWRTAALALAGAVALMTGCTPTPEPTGTAAPSASTPSATRTNDAGTLGEDAYPGQVDGFRFNWEGGVPMYERVGDDVDRINVQDLGRSAEDFAINRTLLGFDAADETSPGVFCQTQDGLASCITESDSLRLWIFTDLVGTLGVDDLAAWTATFLEATPG